MIHSPLFAWLYAYRHNPDEKQQYFIEHILLSQATIVSFWTFYFFLIMGPNLKPRLLRDPCVWFFWNFWLATLSNASISIRYRDRLPWRTFSSLRMYILREMWHSLLNCYSQVEHCFYVFSYHFLFHIQYITVCFPMKLKLVLSYLQAKKGYCMQHHCWHLQLPMEYSGKKRLIQWIKMWECLFSTFLEMSYYIVFNFKFSLKLLLIYQ